MYDLSGKVALVTGAGGKLGIGRAIALRLAQEGADVAVNDLVVPAADVVGDRGILDLVDEIVTMGRRALAVAADVADSRQVQAMVDRVLDTFGHIDILVNNAGARAARDRVPVVDLDEA